MDPSQMILPKGFVVNSQDIYKEVASYPVVPPEKIKEYWKGKLNRGSQRLAALLSRNDTPPKPSC